MARKKTANCKFYEVISTWGTRNMKISLLSEFLLNHRVRYVIGSLHFYTESRYCDVTAMLLM